MTLSSTQTTLRVIAAADAIAQGYPRAGSPVRRGIRPTLGPCLQRIAPYNTSGTDYSMYSDATVNDAVPQMDRDWFSLLGTSGFTRAEIAAALTLLEPWSGYTSETLVARFLGDSQSRSLGRPEAFAQLAAMAEQPLAYISGGDMVADAPTQADWDLILPEIALLGDIAWTPGARPFYAMPGNHDWSTHAYEALWRANLLRQNSLCGGLTTSTSSGEFTFVTGPVRWVILNFSEGGSTTRINQRNWLTDVLTYAPEPWVIPCWHTGTYRMWDSLLSAAPVWSLSAVTRVENAWAATGKCPVCLHAHTHCYGRTKPMLAGVANAAGVTYINAGALAAAQIYDADWTRTETIICTDVGEERTDVTDAADFAEFIADGATRDYGYLDVRATTTTLKVEYRLLSDPTTVVDTVTYTKPS